MSAKAYFGAVALATALGVAAAMLLRPGFAHTVLEWTGLERVPQASADSFYLQRVEPLLEAHCTGCHGTQRAKGGLRLDSLAAVLRGGKHGAVVAANVKDSSLFERITLPMTDDRAMPPSGKTPLNKDEITVIGLWIASGASGTLPARAVKGAPRLVAPVKMPELNPAAVAKARAPLAALVGQLQERLPDVVQYQSRDSADLVINAALRRGGFGDSDLRVLLPLSARIVAVDLSGTAITDAAAPMLAAMPMLRSVRLMGTKTTDAIITALTASKTLKVLVVGKASPAALAPLRQKGVRIYEDADGG
ncbi:MAG TPA: c-type cytochrome domain-containing protein [Rhizomicrobium sp.]